MSPGRGPCVCLALARISIAAAGEPCRGPHRPRRVVWPAAGRWVRGHWGAQDHLHGSVCSRSLGRRRGGTGSPPPPARQRLQGVAHLPCWALPGEVMGKTCADALPRPRIPRATHGLSVAPPSYWEGSPPPGPRVPAQPLAPGLPPSPVRNQLGARFRVQTPHLGLSIAVALICCAFKSLPPLGVGFRKAVPQAPGARGDWPEGGQLNSGEKELTGAPPPKLLHNEPPGNKHKYKDFLSCWSGLPPKVPLNPRGSGQETAPGVGEGLPRAAPRHAPSRLAPSEPAAGQGSLRIPGRTEGTPTRRGASQSLSAWGEGSSYPHSHTRSKRMECGQALL